MIILQPNQVNTIYVTVSDVVDTLDGQFTLNITHTVTNETTPITMSLLNSGSNQRFDEFEVSTSGLKAGKYDYTIENVSGSVAEQGKLEVIGTEITQTQYSREENTVTFYTKD